ncbi:MAG: hypothetical protein ACXW27_08645 [Allosphingosinicella sp.]
MASLAAKLYPSQAAVERAIRAARAGGLDVGGVEVAPDGTIRVMEARAMPKPAEDLFDQLEREGRL